MQHQLNKFVKIEKQNDLVIVTMASPKPIPIDFLYLGLAIATGKCPVFPPYMHHDDYIRGEYAFADKLVLIEINIVDVNMPACSMCVTWRYKGSNLPKNWFITMNDIPKLMEILGSWV